MKKTFFTLISTVLFVFFGTTILSAQDYSKIDERARRIPVPGNGDVEQLAKALTEGCTTEKEKARSFFVWVSEHIHYDIELRENKDEISREKRKQLQEPQQVLKRKKAVCEGYTQLYNALCASAGMKALLVGGTSKNEKGTVSRVGHAWSLVCADGEWGLVDATWGSGVVDADEGKYVEKLNDKYFFPAPETLIADHYPNDPLYQCLENPVDFSTFKAGSIPKKSQGQPMPGYAHLADSLLAVYSRDSSQLMYFAGKRALQVNPKNNYGAWALGKYYFNQADKDQEQYRQALQDLKPVDYYPKESWFDAQLPLLKHWEAMLLQSQAAMKNATEADNYSRNVQSLRQSVERGLNICQQVLSDNPRLKAQVKKGVRVKMMPN